MQYVNNMHAVIDIMYRELYVQGPLVKSRAQALLKLPSFASSAQRVQRRRLMKKD